MSLLVDTHFLLWAAYAPERVTGRARELLEDPTRTPWFSVASLWEIEIKRALGRPDFTVEPGALRAGLLANGYGELPVAGRHVLGLRSLPRHHADPFDRILIAQALSEGMELLTRDARIAEYDAPVILSR